MRPMRKHGELMQQVLHPGPLVDEQAVRSRIRQVDVARFDARLHRLRARQLAALGRDGDDPRHAMGQRVDDRGSVGLPPDVRAQLDAAGSVLGRPQWRVLVDAILAYVGNGPGLSDDERRRVRAALRLGRKSSSA